MYDYACTAIHTCNAYLLLIYTAIARWITTLLSRFSTDKTTGNFPSLVPTSAVLFSTGEVDDVVDIVASAGLTLGLKRSGAVFSFGLNRWGQCGQPRL